MEILDAEQVIEEYGLPYFRELSTFGALSDEVIRDILQRGVIRSYKQGEFVDRIGEPAIDFQVVLKGRMAFYKHCEDHDVLTRHFDRGDQMGFDEMIGLIDHSGTDVAVEDSVVMDISSQQFNELHVSFPRDFGIFMINLSRELSREIAMLEDVIGRGTGWDTAI